ncbi:MAG: hypothetical protein LBT40_18560 [Deltaproteobacteria bacterium]|nr:hypothetical protein [Deltaproteobacteria bacterium]
MPGPERLPYRPGTDLTAPKRNANGTGTDPVRSPALQGKARARIGTWQVFERNLSQEPDQDLNMTSS